jgi:hypothetical protein
LQARRNYQRGLFSDLDGIKLSNHTMVEIIQDFLPYSKKVENPKGSGRTKYVHNENIEVIMGLAQHSYP